MEELSEGTTKAPAGAPVVRAIARALLEGWICIQGQEAQDDGAIGRGKDGNDRRAEDIGEARPRDTGTGGL